MAQLPWPPLGAHVQEHRLSVNLEQFHFHFTPEDSVFRGKPTLSTRNLPVILLEFSEVVWFSAPVQRQMCCSMRILNWLQAWVWARMVAGIGSGPLMTLNRVKQVWMKGWLIKRLCCAHTCNLASSTCCHTFFSFFFLPSFHYWRASIYFFNLGLTHPMQKQKKKMHTTKCQALNVKLTLLSFGLWCPSSECGMRFANGIKSCRHRQTNSTLIRPGYNVRPTQFPWQITYTEW